MASPKQPALYRGFKFNVTIDGAIVAGVNKVGALTRTSEVVSWRHSLAIAYGNRSIAYAEMGRFDEAIADATAAIELEPDTYALAIAIAYMTRGWTFAQLDQLEESAADLDHMETLTSDPGLLQRVQRIRRDFGVED